MTPSPAYMTSEHQSGTLIIIGGAEDKEQDCRVLREFVRHAGGVKARIAVLTAATTMPGEVADEYIEVFHRLGAEDVRIVHTESARDTEDADNIATIEQSTGIFFTGGDQQRLVDMLADTPLHKAVRQQYASGSTIAGTSAGAAMMPDMMIVEGDAQTHPRPEIVKMGPGLAFLPDVIIDQHFAQRGRLGRLLAALVIEPSVLGLGIDENTAVVVEGDEFSVIGSGAVTVVDETASTHNNLDQLLKDEALAVFGIALHILPEGYRFNLKQRQPIAPDG